LEVAGKVRRVALEILAYLAKHPEAKDSLVGIKQWWIEEPDKCSDQDLHLAAAALLKVGLLRTWESSPGSVVFGPSEKFLRAPEAAFREFVPTETSMNENDIRKN
jgi:hypothetical protein